MEDEGGGWRMRMEDGGWRMRMEDGGCRMEAMDIGSCIYTIPRRVYDLRFWQIAIDQTRLPCDIRFRSYCTSKDILSQSFWKLKRTELNWVSGAIKHGGVFD